MIGFDPVLALLIGSTTHLGDLISFSNCRQTMTACRMKGNCCEKKGFASLGLKWFNASQSRFKPFKQHHTLF